MANFELLYSTESRNQKRLDLINESLTFLIFLNELTKKVER